LFLYLPLQESISLTCLRAAFMCADPKSVKRLTTWLSFLRFWALSTQKLRVKRWWNWHLISTKRKIPREIVLMCRHTKLSLWLDKTRMPAKLSNFLKNEKSFYKVFFEKVFDEDEIECSISLLLQNTLKPFWQTLCYKLNAICIAIFDSYISWDLLA